MSVRMYVSNQLGILSPSHAIFFNASHWPSDHMVRSRPLIGPSELCLLDENSEEVHNLQSPDEKMCSWQPSELCLLDENSSITCNLLIYWEEKEYKQKSLYLAEKPLGASNKKIFLKNAFSTFNEASGNKVTVLQSASFERFGVSYIWDFFLLNILFYIKKWFKHFSWIYKNYPELV